MLSLQSTKGWQALATVCLIGSGVTAHGVGVSDFATCGAQMDGWEVTGAFGGVNALFSSNPAASHVMDKGGSFASEFGGQKSEGVATNFKGFVNGHPEAAKLAQGVSSVVLYHDARALKDMIIYSENPGGATTRLLAHHHGKVELSKFLKYLTQRGAPDLTSEELAQKLVDFNSAGKSCLRSALSWRELAKNLGIEINQNDQQVPDTGPDDTEED